MRTIGTLMLSERPGHFHNPGLPENIVTIHASGPVRTTISCGGRTSQRDLVTGDIDFLPATAPIEGVDEGFSSVLALIVPNALLDEVASDFDTQFRGVVPQFTVKDVHLSSLAWALHARRDARQGLYDECLTLEFGRRMITRYGMEERAPDPLTRRQLGRVMDYIESHLHKRLTIRDLAREAGASGTRFKLMFHRTMTMPVHRYVVWRRTERARLLLLAGKQPASQIALDVGFAHQTHMSRWMHRLLGVRPSELKLQARPDSRG